MWLTAHEINKLKSIYVSLKTTTVARLGSHSKFYLFIFFFVWHSWRLIPAALLWFSFVLCVVVFFQATFCIYMSALCLPTRGKKGLLRMCLHMCKGIDCWSPSYASCVWMCARPECLMAGTWQVVRAHLSLPAALPRNVAGSCANAFTAEIIIIIVWVKLKRRSTKCPFRLGATVCFQIHKSGASEKTFVTFFEMCELPRKINKIKIDIAVESTNKQWWFILLQGDGPLRKLWLLTWCHFYNPRTRKTSRANCQCPGARHSRWVSAVKAAWEGPIQF